MSYWGGASAGGWSHSHFPSGKRGLKRSADGWDDDELGKLYDHSVTKRMLPYLKPYRKRLIFALLGMLLFAAASMTQPYLIGLAIDRFVRTGDLEGLNWIGGALIGLAVLAWAGQWMQQLLTAYIGHNVLLTLRTNMFGHIQKLSLGFLDRTEVGRVMSRVQNDVTVLQELLTTGFLTILADFAGLGLVIFFLLYLDVELALITFTVIPVLIVSMAVWQSRARRAFIRVRQAIAIVNANHWSANVEAGRLTAAVMPLMELLVAAATALVVVFGGMRVLDGSLGIGVVIAFALYVQRFFDPIRDLVLQYTQLQRAMAGAQRIFEVLDTQPEIVDAPDALALPDIRGEVTFEHIHFQYVPDVEVLSDIDLHVRPGETIAIVGAPGAA